MLYKYFSIINLMKMNCVITMSPYTIIIKEKVSTGTSKPNSKTFWPFLTFDFFFHILTYINDTRELLNTDVGTILKIPLGKAIDVQTIRGDSMITCNSTHHCIRKKYKGNSIDM
jgi:hypothetical protein